MFENIHQWCEENVQGKLGQATNSMAETIQAYSNDSMMKDTAKKIIPLTTGLAATGMGYTQLPLIEKGVKALFNAASQLATGFGYLEKIPTIGSGFTFLGNTIKETGDYVAYAVPPAIGFLTFNLLQPRDIPSPHGTQTPLHHTGAVATPPETVHIAVRNPITKTIEAEADIPSKPAEPTPLTADINTSAAPTTATPTAENLGEVRARRRRAQVTPDSPIDSAAQAYLTFVNQNYENTRAWAEEAEEFSKGPRKDLVSALQAIGLKAEAEQWVPKPPPLQKTVYKDGTDFNRELLTFIQKFTDCYGETGPQGDTARLPNGQRIFTFTDHANDTPHPKKFSDCSPTQKEEFIAKAIEYFKVRKQFFEKDHVTTFNHYWADIPLSIMKCGETVLPDYSNHEKAAKEWYSATPEGDNNGLLWSEEHKKLKDIGTQGAVMNILPFLPKIEENASVGDKYHALLVAHIRQREAMDNHKLQLENANKTILKAWEQEVKQFQPRLDSLRDTSIAILKTGVYSDTKEAYVTLKDLSNGASSAPIQTLAFKPGAEGKFVLTGWMLEGKPWILPKKTITIDTLTDAKQLRIILATIQSGSLLSAALSLNKVSGSMQNATMQMPESTRNNLPLAIANQSLLSA